MLAVVEEVSVNPKWFCPILRHVVLQKNRMRSMPAALLGKRWPGNFWHFKQNLRCGAGVKGSGKLRVYPPTHKFLTLVQQWPTSKRQIVRKNFCVDAWQFNSYPSSPGEQFRFRP